MSHLLLTNNSETLIKCIISVAESIRREWGGFRSYEGETKITDGKLNLIYKLS